MHNSTVASGFEVWKRGPLRCVFGGRTAEGMPILVACLERDPVELNYFRLTWKEVDPEALRGLPAFDERLDLVRVMTHWRGIARRLYGEKIGY